jgi:ABC-type multidrug transport system ATPase subunit
LSNAPPASPLPPALITTTAEAEEAREQPREPLLFADDLRIDVDGVPACDGITLRTKGSRVLVLGAPRALFEATTGLANVMRGDLRVRGMPVAEAVSERVIAGAAMDPPTPPKWTLLEYLQWSARLSGLSKSDARANADAAITKLQLGTMTKMQTARLLPHAKRGMIVAAALATGAEVIALEDPLGGLPDDVAATYAKVLAEALADRSWIIFAPRIPLTSPIALEADEALIASALGIDVQGSPAEIAAAERRYIGRVHGPIETAIPLLESRGAHVEARVGGAARANENTRFVFDLGPTMTTSDLLRLCDRANVAVIELVPVSRALS